MTARNRKHIAMSVTHGLQFMERIIHGITDYAKQNAHWAFTRPPEMFGTSMEWLEYWHGDGAFCAIYTPDEAKLVDRIGIPIVNLATHLSALRVPSITVDHYEIGELAARHLLEHNFRRFGYYGPRGLHYAELRRDGFCSVIAQAGGEVKMLEVQTVDDSSKQKLDDQQESLEQWLQALKPPVGILASADLRASMVLEACQKLRLRVPEDVTVAGVDNDPLVCDFCDPPLTSISRNDYQVGFEAARLLDQLMDGAPSPEKPIRIPPAGIVQRRSTDTISVEDPYVAEAIRFMREHVQEQFGVDEVLNQLPLSRRSLEYRFRACLGRSPYDYLNQIRVDQAKRLLSDPHRSSLTKIAIACGFGDLRRFRIVFQRLVAASPAEYRQAAFRIARGEPGPDYTLPAHIDPLPGKGRGKNKQRRAAK
ncbi:MAG TPA: substrate-binding domain-containing protein [Pirellulales bacterium]|jgi:LacI family transcriptional regulator